MTEAERLRIQAERCTQLAGQATNPNIIKSLLALAAKSTEQASELERLAVERRQQTAC